MDYNSLQKKYTLFCQHVTNKQLNDGFEILQQLAADSRQADFITRLDNYRQTYRNILQYSFGEIEDPEKKTVYFRLLKSVLELADEIRESLIVHYRLVNYSFEKEELNNHSTGISEIASKLKNKNEQEFDLTFERLFNLFWLTDKFRETEANLASDILFSEKYEWWQKSLLISGITLSLQRYFDETKLSLLFRAYKQMENQVWQRALIGILIVLYQYRSRLYLYPKIKESIDELANETSIQKHAEMAIIQFIKTRDTEKIAKKFRDEIIPEMAKFQSRIYDKLDLKNIVQDPLMEDKNPDWEHVFEDSPDLMNKLEELSMLQMDGSDVMMGTFSMLKQFDFFDKLHHWFLPFYKEEHSLQNVLGNENGNFDAPKFAENMEQSTILCNSDKYSFCFNVNRMPDRERSMMVEMFNMEANAMEEIAQDDELLKKPSYERVVFTQYIQDFYRFNKLYRNHSDFFDIFSTKTDFHNQDFFSWIIKDEDVVRNIGEFFFEKNYYEDAIEVFAKIDTLPENIELWQKIAYSYQKLGNYEKALEFYLRADLTDLRKSWNINKIGLCYRRLGNYEKALQYYLEAEKMEPENLQVQANLAHTYFDMNDFENALKIYFKVEYLAPDNQKIQRPIAWCSFMLGKFDTARKYFEKITQTEGNEHDLLNLGHVEWSTGNKQKAIELYVQSTRKANSRGWFKQEFMADSNILIRNGIDPVDIPLMLDYVQSLAEGV